ncbi:MAG: hypothetical protein U9N52_09745 [Campylobacterota bacterium]|nr:hypothetical protein [Campylobacterota bacterium]
MQQKVIIERRMRGMVDFPDTKDAKGIFHRVKQAYANHDTMVIALVFLPFKLKQLQSYQRGGAKEELENLAFYMDLGKLLEFDTSDAVKLKNSIELINDSAHSNFNISKRVKLINKSKKSKTNKSYLFWDIENFSNIASIFSELIEPYEIEDERIYLAANPDSLYLKKREWEANLYDYGKTLQSFNFTKCDHGKNVADDVLLDNFKKLGLQNSDIYMMTFDRELKERFVEVCHKSNNLYIMKK